MARRRTPWGHDLALAVRKEIKREVDAHAGADLSARLPYIARRIAELANDLSDAGVLQRYTFIMSALVHHERHRGLTPRQVRSLAELAHSLLFLKGVDSYHSIDAFLFGEIHLVLSQIHRRQGKPWQALWEQQMSLHFLARSPVNGPGPQLLATGIRCLRVGDAGAAGEAFAWAEEQGLVARQHEQARLGRLKSLRLARDLSGAATLAAETWTAVALSPEGGLELAWEELCCGVMATGDPRPLVDAVTKKGEHAQGDYLLECFFWTRAASPKRLLTGLPKISTLARNRTVTPGMQGAFLKAALTLEACYDTEVPFTRRLLRLGETLGMAASLISVDKELLLWAAAARWLYRSDQPLLAAVSLGEYRGLSLKLSRGQHADVLGMAHDMLAKDLVGRRLTKLRPTG